MNRRLCIDRRQQQIEAAVERRKGVNRRTKDYRRTHQIEVEVDKRAQDPKFSTYVN